MNEKINLGVWRKNSMKDGGKQQISLNSIMVKEEFEEEV